MNDEELLKYSEQIFRDPINGNIFTNKEDFLKRLKFIKSTEGLDIITSDDVDDHMKHSRKHVVSHYSLEKAYIEGLKMTLKSVFRFVKDEDIVTRPNDQPIFNADLLENFNQLDLQLNQNILTEYSGLPEGISNRLSSKNIVNQNGLLMQVTFDPDLVDKKKIKNLTRKLNGFTEMFGLTYNNSESDKVPEHKSYRPLECATITSSYNPKTVIELFFKPTDKFSQMHYNFSFENFPKLLDGLKICDHVIKRATAYTEQLYIREDRERTQASQKSTSMFLLKKKWRSYPIKEPN